MSQDPRAGGSRESSGNRKKVNVVRGQRFKERAVRNETRGVSSRQGLDYWRGGWGDSGVHLYPKSNKIIGVVYLGMGGVRKTHPDLSFKKTPLCLRMVWRGNRSPPASPVRRPSPHPSGPECCHLPLASWCRELPSPWSAPPCPALCTPGWHPSWLQERPFLYCLPRAPICGSHHWLPGTGDNPLLGRMISSSTGDDSRTRPKSGSTATASWNGDRSCHLAAVMEACCLFHCPPHFLQH